MNIHYLRFVCEAISRIWRTKRIASNSAICRYSPVCLLIPHTLPAFTNAVGPNGEIIYSARPPVNAKVEKTLSFKELPRSAVPASKPDTTKPVELPSDNVVLYMGRLVRLLPKSKGVFGKQEYRVS